MPADPFLAGFADPGPEYSATPFWFWNGDLDPDELVRQIALMEEQGVRAFVVHARKGLTVAYLSEAWFDRVGLVLAEARRRGMRVWIYDEENWPSGYAGGAVLARNPTLTPQCLEPERIWLDDGEPLLSCPAPIGDPQGRGEVVAVIAVPVASWSPRPADELAWHGPPARLTPPWHDRHAHLLEFGPGSIVLPLLPDAPPATDAREIRAWADGLPADLGDGPRGDAARELREAVERVLWGDAQDGHGPLATASLSDAYEAYRRAPFFANPGGRWLLMVFRRCTTEWRPAYTNAYYVDVLRQETAPTFLATTHDEYERRFGEFFGETLVGFFVDEPGLYHNFWDRNPQSVAWTEDFRAAFRAARGYDIVPELVWLYETSLERPDQAERVRFDFYDFVAELFTERFMRPLADWCTGRGVELMGHLMLEEFMVPMVRYAGNPFRALRPLHVPGVDRIDEVYEKVTERIGSSVAHMAGRKRCFSETYALTGWKLAPPMMKEIFDHQAARGVNMLVPHAFYYSIEGYRKDECPPSEFFPNPWWPHSRPFWEYVARVSYALSQGRPVKSFALYYPIETVAVQITPGQPPGSEAGPTEHWQVPNLWMTANATDNAFVRTVVCLEQNGLDFDLIDHTFLADADVSAGRLRVGDLDVATLVLAHATVIAPAAAAQIRDFQSGGGHVVTMGPVPRVVGTEDRIVPDLALPASDSLLVSRLWEGVGGPPPRFHDRRRTPTVRSPMRDVRYVGRPGPTVRRLSDGRRVVFWAPDVTWDESAPRALGSPDPRHVLDPVGSSLRCRLDQLGLEPAPGSVSPSFVLPPQAHGTPPDTLSVEIDGSVYDLDPGALHHPTWAQLGHPFFSGTARYIAAFGPDRVVGVDLVVRETAEVRLNGRLLGFAAVHQDGGHWCMDVRQADLGPEGNTLEVIVASSLAAQFEGKESFAGLLALTILCSPEPTT